MTKKINSHKPPQWCT